MTEVTPSQLDSYESGTDYRIHAHHPGKSVGISVDQLAPAGSLVLSKRNLAESGLYYETGTEIEVGANPILDAIYLETDALDVDYVGGFNVGYKLNRINKCIAKDAFSNDLFLVRDDNSLVKVTEASEYNSEEMVQVETGICGFASTNSHNFIYKTNGDLIVINSDLSERIISFVDGDQVLSGAGAVGDFDFVAVGKRIYKVSDSAIELFFTASATIKLFCSTNSNIYFVKDGEANNLYQLTPASEASIFTSGFNAPFSSVETFGDNLFALESGAAGQAWLQMCNDVDNEFYFSNLESVSKQKYVIPVSNGAAVVYVNANTTSNAFHSLIRNHEQVKFAYSLNVISAQSGGGKDFARVGNNLFINSGANEGMTYPYDTIYQYQVVMPDPEITRIPYVESYTTSQKYYVRRG